MKEFTIEVPLRWGDMDPMDHMNNVTYFRLIEEARLRWFKELGCYRAPGSQAPILAHVSCDFVKALDWPGTAVVRQIVTKVGRSSVEHDITIERSDAPGTVYAKARSVIVWFDYSAGKSMPWPESVRARIA